MDIETKEQLLGEMMGIRDSLQRQCRRTQDNARLIVMLIEGFRNMGIDNEEYVLSCFKILERQAMLSEDDIRTILANAESVYCLIKSECDM